MNHDESLTPQTREVLIEYAYHEAAHAVVGNAFSQEIKWMWIDEQRKQRSDLAKARFSKREGSL